MASCYQKLLELAVVYPIKTIAFPNISTGIYGFPKERAAEIAINKVFIFLEHDQTIEKVVFVCFDDGNYDIYKNILQVIPGLSGFLEN